MIIVSINKEEELANVFHEIRLVLTSLRFFHQCKSDEICSFSVFIGIIQ